MNRYFATVIALFVYIALPVFSVAEDEDQSRCICWYAGFDAQEAGFSIEGDGPGGSKDECDLIGMMLEWEDGWAAAEAKKDRECP